MSDQYVKHTTHTDALDTLGTIIGDGEKRDAIHLAVEPVVAHVRVAPGQHVVLGSDGEASPTGTGNGVGIVDPFLDRVVEPGERFWLVVYPRQISSLRHVWEHPDFPPSGETREPSAPALGRDVSETWLRDYADSLHAHPYTEEGHGTVFDELIRAALERPEYMHFGFDIYGEIPAEFWHHVQVYTGQRIGQNRAEYFSCSC